MRARTKEAAELVLCTSRFSSAGARWVPTIVAPQYRLRITTAVPGTAKAESLADIPWWELFKDPVLQELTRDALRNNYDLRTAAARVEEARAQIGVSRSFFYPQLTL